MNAYRVLGAVIASASMMSAASGALISRGFGLVYDTDLNITWLADGNYARTSGFSADGKLTWSEAVAWADGLTYGGYSDWRLPVTFDRQMSCRNIICNNSEMGHLFFDELGGVPGSFILTSSDPDLALFSNVQDYYYWTGNEWSSDPQDPAFAFGMGFGTQEVYARANPFYALAVRDGDVAASVAEPSTHILAIFALVTCLAYRRVRHQPDA